MVPRRSGPFGQITSGIDHTKGSEVRILRQTTTHLSFGKGDHHGKGRGDLHYVDANGTNTTTEQSPTVICEVRTWRHGTTTGTTGTSVPT